MMTDYVIKVVDAVGVTIGPVHTEVMVDDDGPVLIEVNARLAGGEQPAFTPTDIDTAEFVGKELLNSLPSVQSWIGFKGNRHYPATIDFFTEIGVVFMATQSEEELDKDFKVLTDIEMNHMEKLFRMKKR